jgi:hypothetical protein
MSEKMSRQEAEKNLCETGITTRYKYEIPSQDVEKMRQHSASHSPQHMSIMRTNMKMGRTFKESHDIAQTNFCK